MSMGGKEARGNPCLQRSKEGARHTRVASIRPPPPQNPNCPQSRIHQLLDVDRRPVGSATMVPRILASSPSDSSDLLRESSPTDQPGRVPKKIHKAEREKLKRDHQNELFQELGQTLEPSRQNNGKASVLADAAKLLRDLIAQVDSLKRENAALQNESRYVTLERNELKDETTVLGVEIERLQMEIRDRMQHNPSWSNAAPAHTSPPRSFATAIQIQQSRSPTLPIHCIQQSFATTLPIQQPPVVGSMYGVPVRSDQPCAELSDPTAHISRPHARYPTSTDSWPYQILTHQPSDDGEPEEAPSTPKELLLLI